MQYFTVTSQEAGNQLTYIVISMSGDSLKRKMLSCRWDGKLDYNIIIVKLYLETVNSGTAVPFTGVYTH